LNIAQGKIALLGKAGGLHTYVKPAGRKKRRRYLNINEVNITFALINVKEVN